ncbi:hypothetical protein BMF94_3761 [Rhodotorula taiwanensis]|uniref:Uncharacterized protein n=1 Tax=Rhodotorula taiwanensis TaxID=741276 RepID=A0A2S5B9H4_9BASI|nr:hypothetical protein BMF94_3761 [Rhodotorula taiwanensis]
MVEQRRRGAIRLEETRDAADSAWEKGGSALDPPCPVPATVAAYETSTVSAVLTWCSLICAWLEAVRYFTKLEDGGIRYVLSSENAAVLIIPLLGACIAASAAAATVSSFETPVALIVRISSSGVFALPWIFVRLCVDVGDQWRSAILVFGLLVYQLALILWSITLQEEREARENDAGDGHSTFAALLKA